jgi:hypothetical protein
MQEISCRVARYKPKESPVDDPQWRGRSYPWQVASYASGDGAAKRYRIARSVRRLKNILG